MSPYPLGNAGPITQHPTPIFSRGVNLFSKLGKHRLLLIVIGLAIVIGASVPSFMTASCLTRLQTPAEMEPGAQAPRRRYGADVELPIEVSNDEERRFHTDARRFARLLVSEIKLYKESQVNEGRSRNDLYDRLRDDIERSREMYEKRVKPEVAQRYDYFHHELLNTLAEGDAAKLGSSYPGATVSA